MRAAINAEGTIKGDETDSLVTRWLTLPEERRGTSRHLRKIGNLMSKDELKSIGLRTNSKITHEAYESLSDQAKTDPLNAFNSLSDMALNAMYQRRSAKFLSELKSDPDQNYSAIIMWHHRCRAAMRDQAELGDEFSPHKVPDLPRPDCDFSVCGCCISYGLWDIEHDHTPQSTSPNLSSKPNIITRLLSLFTKP